MNLPRSPKEVFSELPQLLLERSENDDVPDAERLNTPNYVREAAVTSVSRWQWKLWKNPSPLSPTQKKQKQRKYPLPGTSLTPLTASLSPGRHNAGVVEKLDNLISEIAEREAACSTLIRPSSAEIRTSNGIGSPLPPLEIQILQRSRLCLDLNGPPTVVVEQLVRLQEHYEATPPASALQLTLIPKKCVGGDEIALMPCHSLQHRGYEMLSAEQWREPVRDRNKQWLQDELPLLVRGHFQTAKWSMTRVPGPNNRGKWAKFESSRFNIPPRSPSTACDKPTSPVTPAKRPQRVLLRAQGALISRSYCVITVFGEGIYGRLYGVGLTGKDKKRCLRVEAYEPATSRTYHLLLTLQDIEWVFRAGGNDPEREALLAPGRKQELLRQLIQLLYFEYPEDSDNRDVVRSPKAGIQVLKISPEIHLNESALRRLEREERLRQDEARRLEDLAALLAKPRRARHRVICQSIRLRGRHFYLSVYHFPAQARNLVFTAYNPGASMTYRLTIGLLEAASLVRLYPYPRSGFTSEQTLTVARGLIPRLQLHGREDNTSNARMLLAISGGRQGPGMNSLPQLAPLMTEERQRDELFNKMLLDSQRSLQLELEMSQLQRNSDVETEHIAIRQEIAKLDAKRAEINEKDQTHKIRIEDIDAAGGGANADVKSLHEERRTHKTARQALKAEMKSIAAQHTQLNQQLQAVSEKKKTGGERAQRRADRARKRIREEVLQTVAATLRSTVPLNQHLPVGQRTWLAKIHMRPGHTLLSSGGCRVSGKRVRYSLFALEPESDDAVDDDVSLFSLELYDPGLCLHCTSLIFSKLEWIALTKKYHEQQQLVPELAPPASAVATRLTELRESMTESRRILNAVPDAPPVSSSKGKASKSKSSTTSKKKREELQRLLTAASNEMHRLSREAPWLILIKALCERCTITSVSDPPAFDVALDRCIFRGVSPVLRMSNDELEDGDSGAVYCRVRVEVLPLAEAVVFDVWDPLDSTQWRVVYPESRELLREFAVETFIEQQMHLEVIMMSLLLQVNEETGQLELHFEE